MWKPCSFVSSYIHGPRANNNSLPYSIREGHCIYPVCNGFPLYDVDNLSTLAIFGNEAQLGYAVVIAIKSLLLWHKVSLSKKKCVLGVILTTLRGSLSLVKMIFNVSPPVQPSDCRRPLFNAMCIIWKTMIASKKVISQYQFYIKP